MNGLFVVSNASSVGSRPELYYLFAFINHVNVVWSYNKFVSFVKKYHGAHTLLAVAASLAFPAGGALAQDDAAPAAPEADFLSAEEALVLDGRIYAQQYNVSLEEAMRRILVMAESSDGVAELNGEFGAQVGGVYFDHGRNFGLKVKLTGKTKPAARRIRTSPKDRRADAGRSSLPSAALAQAERRRQLNLPEAALSQAGRLLEASVEVPVDFIADAPVSREALEAAVVQHVTALKQLVPTPDAVGYSERTGTLDLAVVGDEGSLAAETRTAVERLVKVPVRYDYVRQPLPTLAVRGGVQTVLPNGSPWCTTAFVGYDPQNRPGVFTASHCYRRDGYAQWYRDTDGKMYNLVVDPGMSAWTTHGDLMFLRFPTGLSGQPYFYANKGEPARRLTGRRTISSTSAKDDPGVTEGSWICYYGRNTGPIYGQGCREVRKKGITIPLEAASPNMYQSAGTPYYVWVQGPSSSMRCIGGDSGAPFFAYTTAFGVMSRCAENHIGSDSVAYYTSLDMGYSLNYRLAY